MGATKEIEKFDLSKLVAEAGAEVDSLIKAERESLETLQKKAKEVFEFKLEFFVLWQKAKLRNVGFCKWRKSDAKTRIFAFRIFFKLKRRVKPPLQ